MIQNDFIESIKLLTDSKVILFLKDAKQQMKLDENPKVGGR